MDLFEAGATVPAQVQHSGPGRRAARFVLLSDLPMRTNRATDAGAPKRVTWRLIAANNRSIGQASVVFGTVEHCLADIERITRLVARLAVSVHFYPGSCSSSSSHWTWTVQLDQLPVAISTHRYKRRVECERALGHFVDAIRLRPPLPAAGRLRRLGERLPPCPA